MEHKLGIEIVETKNEKILRLIDASIYVGGVPVVCPKIYITAPGFQFSSVHEVDENFNMILTACDLEIQSGNCDSQQNNLPDGVYAIKYTVSPHEYLFTEVNHLRLSQTYNRIEKLYCNLGMPTSDLTGRTKEKLSKINEVENYLKASKASIETCQNTKYGTELYKYAIKLLDRIDCKNC